MNDVLSIFGSYDALVRESLILALVALSVQVLLNAGMFALPQVGLMAIGSYTTAILSVRLEWSPILSIPAAVVLSAGVAWLLGSALRRLDGIQLALATIAFNEIVRVMLRNSDYAGSTIGITGIERIKSDVYLLLTVGLIFVLMFRLGRTHLGRITECIRVAPLVASHQGVDEVAFRLRLFALSGAIAGLGGAMHVHLSGFVEPNRFSFDLLILLVAATILGGMFSALGPLLGGAVIFTLPVLVSEFSDYREIVNGVLIVVIVAAAPGGMVAILQGCWHRLNRLLNPSGSAEPWPYGDEIASGPGETGWPQSRRAPAAGDLSSPLLTLRQLDIAFGGVHAVDHIDLALHEREILGVIGPNGSGKTTLINLLSGVYTPSGGSIELAGQRLSTELGRPERLRRLGLARTFQGVRLVPHRTALENVVLGADATRTASIFSTLVGGAKHRREQRELESQANDLLRDLGLAVGHRNAVGDLPYGQQRRVEIARALMGRPKILLLDEPTAGMTSHERAEVFAVVQMLPARGVSVIIIEHDVASMTQASDRLAVLNFGQVIACGVPDDVLREGVVVDAYIGTGTAT